MSAELTVSGELYVLDASGLISANNNHISATDSLDTASAQALGGSLNGLVMGDFVFELMSAVFPGTGITTLPSLTDADAGTIFSPIFEEGFTFEPQYQFDILSVSINTSVVPIPAAAWLFGSALLGLVVMKRKKVLLTTKRSK